MKRPFDDFDLHQQSDERSMPFELPEAGDFEDDETDDENELSDVEDETLNEEEADAEFGRTCSICGEEFVKEHGVPTVCSDCAKAYPEQVVAEGLGTQVHALKKDA